MKLLNIINSINSIIQVAGLLLRCFKAIAALFKKHALQHYDLLLAQVGTNPSRSVDFPALPLFPF